MEVKPGYKLTEVGVIPEDWETTPLNSVADVRDGTHDSPKYVKNGVPFVTSKNIISGEINIQDVSFISKADAQEVNKRSKVDRLDILVSMIGTVGNAALVNFEPDFCIKNVALIKPHNWAVESRYLTQLLRSDSHARYIEGKLDGGIQKFISLGVLRQIEIPLPPLPEQTAIATTLSDVDALISSLDALISKKKQIKQGAMQELLSGKRRLPGFSGEWEVVTLFKLAEGKKEYFNDGDWIESEHITTDGIRFIQTGNIGVGYFIEKHDRKYISEKSFASLSCKEINLGDLLICRLADPAGRACVLPDIGESKVVTSVDVTIFRAPPSSANRVYLALLFSTSNWFKSISDRSGGTTHKRIARGALGKISITLPPLPEQQAIAAILSDMDAKITTLESRRNKTKLLKQGMMQELLTGRIRLIPPAAHAVSA